jgi:hypothetical protein
MADIIGPPLHPGELLTKDPDLKLGDFFHDSDPEERSKEILARRKKEYRELLLENKKMAAARKGESQTE